VQRQSEEVLGLMATTDEVVTSIEIHGMTVAARLDEPRTPAATQEAEGSTAPPNFRDNMVHLKVNLAASAQTMATSDQRHVGQLATLIGLRQERQELEQVVYGKFTALRVAFDILHGPGQAFVLAGIEGPTARTARKLVRQVDLAVGRLGQPGLVLPTPNVGGIHLDAVGMAADLRHHADRLRAVLAAQQRERRVAQETRKEKNRAKDRHDRLLLWSARTLEGYYQLAGEQELAERIRPATRRLGRPASPTPDTPGDETPESPPDAETPEEPEPDDPDSEDPGEITPTVIAPPESAFPTADD
jgi:hypothetical protein